VVQQAIAENQKFANRAGELIGRVALGLANIGTAPPEQANNILTETEQLVEKTGAVYMLPQLLATSGFQAAFAGDNAALSRITDQVRRTTGAYGFEGYYTDILPVWSGDTTRLSVDRASTWQWFGGTEEALQRWHDVLEARRALAY